MQPVQKPTNDPNNEAPDRLVPEAAPKLNIVPPPESPEPPTPEAENVAAPEHPTPVSPLLGGQSVPKLHAFDIVARPSSPTSAARPSLYTSAAPAPQPAPPQGVPMTPRPITISSPDEEQAEQPHSAPVSPAEATAIAGSDIVAARPAQSPPSPTASESVATQPVQQVGNSQNWFQPTITGGDGAPPNSTGAGMVMGAPIQPTKRFRLPKFARLGLIVVLVLALAAGYVFGWYIPNKPENVFKTGLTRTGSVIDKLTTPPKGKAAAAPIKAIDLGGKVTVTEPHGTHSGTFSSHYDDTTSDSLLTYRPDGSGKMFTIEGLSQLGSGQSYPDIYFKFTNLALLGLDQSMPELTPYDGKWINISPAFLQSVEPSEYAAQQTKQSNGLTPQDVDELTKAVLTPMRAYIFTNDPTKNVLVNKGFKGKEKIEGNLTANHYVVGINKAHMKDYCSASISSLFATQAFKHLPGAPTSNLSDAKNSAIKDCQQSVDKNIKDSDTFDMWVNTGNKLINKVRFTDSQDKTAYVDIGQTYTKGNVLPMFYTMHSSKDHYDATMTLDMDLSKNISNLGFNGTFGQDKDKWTVKLNATFQPYQGDLKITKPTGSIPVSQVLQSLGIDPSEWASDQASAATASSSSGSSLQQKGQDTERETDLKALQSQLEAYYASNGEYPTLDEINNAPWRVQNMQGLDSSALADPVGQNPQLVATATSTQYGYKGIQCGSFSGCQDYTLTAVLSDGSVYKINGLGNAPTN